jgi:hypothetical protein
MHVARINYPAGFGFPPNENVVPVVGGGTPAGEILGTFWAASRKLLGISLADSSADGVSASGDLCERGPSGRRRHAGRWDSGHLLSSFWADSEKLLVLE